MWRAHSPSNLLTRDVSVSHSIPLCYIYPAMLHYKACARTRLAKAKDIALGVFGLAAAIFTTVQTIKVSQLIVRALPALMNLDLFSRKLMVEPGSGEDPQYGVCSPAGPNDSTPLGTILEYVARSR